MSVEEQMFRVVVEEWNREADEQESITTPRGVQCRICMQNADPETVLSPCLCVGSVQYVHESCLKTWLLAQGSLEAARCELCQTPFHSEYRLGWVCKLRNLLNISNSFALLSWFGVVIQVIFLILVISISMSLAFGSNTDMQNIALAAILGILCLMEILLAVTTIYFIVKACVTTDVKFWKIYDCKAKKLGLDDIEGTYLEPQNESQQFSNVSKKLPYID